MQNLKELAKSVIIAHAGTQHSHQAAMGLFRAGLLQKFITGYFYNPDGVLATLLKICPDSFRGLFYSQLMRRRRAELPASVIKSYAVFDFASILLSRLKFAKKTAQFFAQLHQKHFVKFALGQIKKNRPSVFIGFEGSAYPYFLECEKLGICKILDQTTASVFKAAEIYSAEIQKYPDLRHNLGFNHDEEYFRRHRMELELADGILVASSYTRKNLIDCGVKSEKIWVVPYGVDIGAFSTCNFEKPANSAVRIVFAGILSQHKGVMYLIEAFRQLNSKNVELCLIGTNQLPDKLTNSLPANVKLIGHQPHSQLIREFHNADIFVFPSIHDGAGMVILEAMAAGLPVIATTSSIAPDLIDDGQTGFIIPPFDTEAIKKKIDLLVENSGLRRMLAQNASQKARDFSWERYHDKLSVAVREIFISARIQL